MQSYDVVIVGAGPAGLKCAEVLAKNNKKVLVLEKNKILGDKICAGGISLRSLDLGIPDKLLQRKFKRCLLHTKSRTTDVLLDSFSGATINRKDLGKYMGEKARKSGAEIKLNSSVIEINESSVIINNREKIHYSYLVGADGANSIVRKYLGIKTEKFIQAPNYIIREKMEYPEVFFDPKKFGPLYLWIFPHKNLTSVGTGWLSIKGLKKPLFGIKLSEMIDNLTSFCNERFNMKNAKFQSYVINFDYKGHEFGNKFLVGEAAGLVSGLTGEGISFAIMSGEDVANKILGLKNTYPQIEHILRVKKFEEDFMLKILRSNKIFTALGYRFLCFISRTKFFGRLAVRKMS
jgi:geranylgeranyl reductase family protein